MSSTLIPIPSFYFGYNAVAWSIFTEIFFYFLFPYLNRLNCKNNITTCWQYSDCIHYIILFVFYCCTIFSQNYLDSLSLHGIAYIHPFFRLPEFIFGILAYKLSLALLNSRVPINILFKCILRFLKYPIFVDILCFSFIYFCFSPSSPLDFAPASVQITLSQIKSGFGFSLFICLISNFDCCLRRLFSMRPFVFLGRISLGFYLFHQPLMIRFSNLGGFDFTNYALLDADIIAILD